MSNLSIPLLPCPWCGSERVGRAEIDDVWAIDCKDCWAMGPTSDDGESAAIAAWNKGPYVDRLEIHAAALRSHAAVLNAQAEEHRKKAQELEAKAHAAEQQIDAAYKQGSEEGAARARSSLMYETERHQQLRESVAAFEAASGVHISSWDGGKIGAAVKIVQEEQGTRNRVASSLKELRSKLQSHVDALDKSLQALAEEASA